MITKQSQCRRGFDPNRLTARNVVVLVPVILGVTALFIVFAFLVSDDTYIRWGGLSLDTAVLFGFLLYHSRAVVRRSEFWALMGGFLAVHLVLWVVVLKLADQWRLAWFGLMALEAPLFIRLRDRAIAEGTKRSERL